MSAMLGFFTEDEILGITTAFPVFRSAYCLQQKATLAEPESSP